MDLITSRLDLQFGSFPEPVIFLAGGQAVYSNEPGQQLLQSETCPLDLLAALAEHPSGSMEIALGQATYRVTVSPLRWGTSWFCVPCPSQKRKSTLFPTRSIGCGSACLTSLPCSGR